MNPDSERKKLDEAFEELLDPESSIGRGLFLSIRRTLDQFRLGGLYNEACVINEVYLRAIKLINQGKCIENYSAWGRSTAYNYIRELSRSHKKIKPFDENISDIEHQTVSEEAMNEDLLTIRKAFQKLNPQEQQILFLSTIQEISFKQISELLSQDGGKEKKESTLRKAKQRALKRLRENYHSLKLGIC